MSKTMNNEKIPVILCVGDPAGRALVFGWTTSLPAIGEPCEVTESRMILRYEGSAGLFGLAARGPRAGSRLTSAVPWTRQVPRQVVAVSAAAATAIAEWPDAD